MIREANRDQLTAGSDVAVGMKLSVPLLPAALEGRLIHMTLLGLGESD